jgi:hypothetical protein
MVHRFFETVRAVAEGLSAPKGGARRRSTTVTTKR